MNWEEVQALANVVLALTSAGAIGYAALQLRHEREYRSVSNLEKQLSFFLGESFIGARQRLAASRIQDDSLQPLDPEDPPVTAFEVLDFYDHLGLLVIKGHLDLYDVWHTFYEWAQPVYIDLKPMIEGAESPYCDHYSHLRRLMRSMDEIQLKRMHAKNANHWELWTPDRILDYYRYEMEMSQGARRERQAKLRSAGRLRAAELKAEKAELRAEHAEQMEETSAGRK